MVARERSQPRLNGSRLESVAVALCAVLGVAAALAPAACNWSSGCTNGKITTDSLPDATVGQGYLVQLEHNCGSGDGVTWTLGDAPPPGIALNFDGRLFGTPTTAGNYSLQVSATFSIRGPDSSSYPAGTDTRVYTLTVRP